jgi:hypothetical protein
MPRVLSCMARILGCTAVLAVAQAARAQAPAERAPPPDAPVVPAAPESGRPARAAPAPVHDRISVVLPPERAALLLDGLPREGRMLLFLVATNSRLDGSACLEAPFFEAPQPIFSVPVAALEPGRPVEIGVDAAAFPAPLDELSGEFRVQAVFRRNPAERSHLAPGNLVSEERTIRLDPGRADTIALELTRALPAPAPPEAPNLRLVEMRSPLLSAATGREVVHRAGVALPRGWDDPSHRRRLWPAVYVVPGFGGRFDDALRYARMLATEGSQSVVPQAVWIVLDPESPWGHHGFVDSPANGPRGRALVEELIPELEREFRLIPRVEARILTGHSSGGWTGLWLQLSRPDVFGACFAAAPDPVDFSAFQRVDLYTDVSYFSDAEGAEHPSYRTPVIRTLDKVRMTNREEAGMEHALSPEGRSGEQLDAYAAMFSALDPATRLPRRAWDPETGVIDRRVIEDEWSRFDIARLVRGDPARYVPILRQRVRLLVGSRDNFYLERAVARLKDAVERAVAAAAAAGHPFPPGPGYIEILPEETHFTIPAASMLRWHREMREYLKEHGLD